MTDRARIFLVAPAQPEQSLFQERLSEALGAAEVAAVLFGSGTLDGEGATELVRRVQAAGAAALVADDTRIMGRLKADGLHIGGGLGDIRSAVAGFRPQRIVGAGNLYSRDTAMQAGEIGVDYLFFGQPYGDTHDGPHAKALDLAAWWAEIMQIPCVLMAGRTIAGVQAAAASGADFVALHDFIWAHAEGPAQAMREAAAVLGRPERQAV